MSFIFIVFIFNQIDHALKEWNIFYYYTLFRCFSITPNAAILPNLERQSKGLITTVLGLWVSNKRGSTLTTTYTPQPFKKKINAKTDGTSKTLMGIA
jgi:hypothetical protein